MKTSDTLPKEGEKIWNHGHEFIVTEPNVHLAIKGSGSVFTHQFTYKGVCTDIPENDSIRNTGVNGGVYGFGVNL